MIFFALRIHQNDVGWDFASESTGDITDALPDSLAGFKGAGWDGGEEGRTRRGDLREGQEGIEGRKGGRGWGRGYSALVVGGYTPLSTIYHSLYTIGVGDGGGWHVPPDSGKIFFGQLSCKVRAFCLFFIHIFSGKMSCPLPMLTELLPMPATTFTRRICSLLRFTALYSIHNIDDIAWRVCYCLLLTT